MFHSFDVLSKDWGKVMKLGWAQWGSALVGLVLGWVHSMLGLSIAKLSPQLQVKLCLKAELVLISANPATHPRPGKFIFQHFSVNLDQETLQEYSRTQIGRRSQFLGKWKTTSIIWKMEDDLNSLENGQRPQCF